MGVINRALANTYTYFDAKLLDTAFQVCDPGLPNPIFLLKFINTSDVNILISYDGVYCHDVILHNSEVVLPFQEGSKPRGDIALMARGMPVYVAKETNPGKGGYLYVISYYQPIIG